MTVKKELLAVLACPACKGEVTPASAGDGLVCKKCNLLYPVKEGIPIMLVDEARKAEGGKKA